MPMSQPNFDDLQRLDRRTAFLGVTRPSIGRDAMAEVADSLRSGWVIAGPKVRTFEQLLEDRLAVVDAPRGERVVRRLTVR